jgi:hypothetical protein
MRAAGWAGVVASVVAFLACGEGVTIRQVLSTASEVPSTEVCDYPLGALCSTWVGCPSYEERVASTRGYGASPECFGADIGVCGEFRYTTNSHAFGGTTLYFDASGKLVAAVWMTDAIRLESACPGRTYYGPRLACTLVPVERLCKAWPYGAGTP